MVGEERVVPARLMDVPFQAHVELLRRFLAHRDEIVERIQGILNAQRQPMEYLQDRGMLSRHFEDCFFALAGMTHGQFELRGQLQEAHWARGFEPRASPGMSNDLVDPAELMRRGFHLWTRTRWPGRNGRVRYAHTLFNLYLIRQLALLGMRVWDAGGGSAGERLAQIQDVLDALWKNGGPDQPVLVRDARCLIPVALSPATEELAPYFEVAEHVATMPADDDRVGILEAVVRMGGGHLRSYLHYYITQKDAVLDEPRLVLLTRKSDALDFSLLLHGLVPLLAAYESAVHAGDRERRLELADAICQGISPDPELFVNRVDLLAAYSMVEYLFTTTDRDGRVVYTPLGERHVELLDEYAARIARLAQPLHEDCAHFRPLDGAYSPYGAIFGFSSNLLEHMALKLLDRDADTRFGLEDVFTGGGADKLAWVSGWRKLPHVTPEVAKLYAYPQWFAERIFARIEQALRRGAAGGAAARGAVTDGAATGSEATGGALTGSEATGGAATGSEAIGGETAGGVRTGRLFVVTGAGTEEASEAASNAATIADLPLRYILSSDAEIVAAQKACAYDEAQLLSDRQEGHFILSYATANGWVAITKDILTEVLGAGHDAKLVGLPAAAVDLLRLLGRDLVAR